MPPFPADASAGGAAGNSPTLDHLGDLLKDLGDIDFQQQHQQQPDAFAVGRSSGSAAAAATASSSDDAPPAPPAEPAAPSSPVLLNGEATHGSSSTAAYSANLQEVDSLFAALSSMQHEAPAEMNTILSNMDLASLEALGSMAPSGGAPLGLSSSSNAPSTPLDQLGTSGSVLCQSPLTPPTRGAPSDAQPAAAAETSNWGASVGGGWGAAVLEAEAVPESKQAVEMRAPAVPAPAAVAVPAAPVTATVPIAVPQTSPSATTAATTASPGLESEGSSQSEHTRERAHRESALSSSSTSCATPTSASAVPSSIERPKGAPQVDLGKFRTKVCRAWASGATCQFAERCAFAHGSDQVRASEDYNPCLDVYGPKQKGRGGGGGGGGGNGGGGAGGHGGAPTAAGWVPTVGSAMQHYREREHRERQSRGGNMAQQHQHQQASVRTPQQCQDQGYAWNAPSMHSAPAAGIPLHLPQHGGYQGMADHGMGGGHGGQQIGGATDQSGCVWYGGM